MWMCFLESSFSCKLLLLYENPWWKWVKWEALDWIGSDLTSWDLEVWATKPPPWKWITKQGEDGRRLVFSPSDREMAPPSERDIDNRVSLSWKEWDRRVFIFFRSRTNRQTIEAHCKGLIFQKHHMTADRSVWLESEEMFADCVYNKQSLFSLLIYFIASVSNRAPLREGLTSCSAPACCQPFLSLHERTLIPIH